MTDGRELNDPASRNRAFWDDYSDTYQADHGPQLAIHGAGWGVWQIPEAELRILGDVAGRDVLELGCGAAQWSIALARRGARVIGLDLSQRQLDHAAAAIEEAGVQVSLIHGNAESVPLPDASFDVMVCDHGAMVFADPYVTVPEVARLLRDGGQLAFSMHTPLAEVCWPAGSEEPVDQLVNDYFGMHRVDLGEAGHAEFQVPYGEWIRLFVQSGFAVEDLVELRPGPDAISTYQTERGRDWARRWPLEHIWSVRRRR
ncbi:MAG: class I SAM-dependent methyltransferase [Candidatus Limnocylindria bacterium]